MRKSRFSAPHPIATADAEPIPPSSSTAQHTADVTLDPPLLSAPVILEQDALFLQRYPVTLPPSGQQPEIRQLVPPVVTTPFVLFDAQFLSKLQRAWGRNFAYIRRKDLEASQPRPQPQVLEATSFVPAHSNSNLGSSLYVTGLPIDILEEDLHLLFSKQGKIKRIKLYLDGAGGKKGDALVTFYKAEVVDVCIALYNRRDIGDGCVIGLSRAVLRSGDAAVAPAQAPAPALTDAEEGDIAQQVEAVDAFLTSLL